MVPLRTVGITSVAALGVLTLVTPASAQFGSDVAQFGFDAAQLAPVLRSAVAFVSTLVAGAVLLAVAPEYTRTVTDVASEQPGRSFAWGLGIFVAIVVIFVVLIVTIIGIVVVIPLAIGLFFVGLASQALGNLTVGLGLLRLAGRGSPGDGEWVGVLLVACVFAAAVAAVPLWGDVVSFVVGSVGIGAMAMDYLDAA